MTLKRFFYLVAVIAFLLVVGVSAFYYYTTQYFSSPSALSHDVVVVIPKGASTKRVTHILHENGVIDKPFLFSWSLRLTEKDHKLQSGEYAFPASVTPKNVVEKLINGDVVQHMLTIPEGWSVLQIRALLESNDQLIGEVPEGIAEGSLLPETYTYYLGDSRMSVVVQMERAMDEVLERLWSTRAKNNSFETKQAVLVLASIIEKETSVPEERAHIAGVFINRLKKNMPLQTDPSVIYAITKGKAALDRPLSRKDLKTKSPYNTYLNKGLPPGPIANPGQDALFATLHPEVTEDLYFVADGSGGHAFAKTLKGHIRNINKWRKFRRLKKLEK